MRGILTYSKKKKLIDFISPITKIKYLTQVLGTRFPILITTYKSPCKNPHTYQLLLVLTTTKDCLPI